MEAVVAPAFVAEASNILLLGPTGVGETHLTIDQGHGVYFVRAYDLMEDPGKARAEHNLDRSAANLPGAQGAGRGRVRHLAL